MRLQGFVGGDSVLELLQKAWILVCLLKLFVDELQSSSHLPAAESASCSEEMSSLHTLCLIAEQGVDEESLLDHAVQLSTEGALPLLAAPLHNGTEEDILSHSVCLLAPKLPAQTRQAQKVERND